MIKEKLITLFVFILSLIFVSQILAQNGQRYDQIRIEKPTIETVQLIQSLGIPLEHAHGSLGRFLEFIISESEARLLDENGIAYRTTIQDVGKFYAERSKEVTFDEQLLRESLSVKDFGFGSMGGFYTFDEVVEQLDSLFYLYPNVVTEKVSIGTSIEGRPIWMVKISDNPTVDEDEPEIFYNALHHAREPQGMMTVLYFMWYLCKNYGSEPEVTYLVDNRELYFVPVVNPDGYVYNEIKNPNGGGLWRKNRRDNGDGSFGVDLNRNYEYEWGRDDEGSSPNTFSNVYRGTAPFSEPETRTIRDFCITHNFKLTLNYHTYSNLLIYPWGYERDLETPDSLIYREYATNMTQFNGYTYGTGNQTVGYIVNGDSDDWMYGEQTDKNKILAMTPEVGGSNDGFWPSRERIFPLAEENLFPNLFLAHVAGSYYMVKDFNIADGNVNPGATTELSLEVKNLGLMDGTAEVTAYLASNDPYVNFLDEFPVISFGIIPSRMTATESITMEISADASNGYIASFQADIYEGNTFITSQEFEFVVGTPIFVFTDFAENGTDNWYTGVNWDTVSTAYEGNFSFHDSPEGDYISNAHNVMTLKTGVDISSANAAFLEFWTKWEIEGNWDFGQVEISIDGGNSWTPLAGKYTNTGSGKGVQPLGEPGYEGFQNQWVKESINISNYIGNSDVRFRFELQSDGFLEFDGWYVDKISVVTYQELNRPIVSVDSDSILLVTFEALTARSYFTIQNFGAEILTYSIEKSSGNKKNINTFKTNDAAILKQVPRSPIVKDPENDFFGHTLPLDQPVSPDVASVEAEIKNSGQILQLTFTFYTDVDTNLLGIVSLDVDENFGTGSYPAAFGLASPTQSVGSEYEVIISTGNFKGVHGFMLVAAGDTSLTPLPFGVGFITIQQKAISLSFPLDIINSPRNINFSAIFLEMSDKKDSIVRLPDWVPDFGHGRTFGEEDLPWLGFGPIQGELDQGAIDTVKVLTVANMDTGNYSADLIISSNDANTPQLMLPIALEVLTRLDPEIEISISALRDTLSQGETSGVNLSVENIGTGDLFVGAVLTQDWVTLDGFFPGFQFQQIAPDSSGSIGVNFSAENLTPGELFETKMTLMTNDPDEILIEIPVSLFVDFGLTVESSVNSLPESYTLEQNYPNPFNPTTEIRYAIPEAEFIQLEIYNILGQKIRTLVNEFQPAGYYQITWNGRDDANSVLPSGIYFYKLKSEHFKKTRRLILLK